MKPCTSSFSTFALGALLIAAYFFALAGPPSAPDSPPTP